LQLGLRYDRHFAIFEGHDGQFRRIDDAQPLAKVVQKWHSQDSLTDGEREGGGREERQPPFPPPPLTRPSPRSPNPIAGPRKLYFKRFLRIPGCKAEEDEEETCTGPDAPAHRLAFAAAAHHFLHAVYRFDVATVVSLAVMLLQGTKGAYDKAMDTLPRVR
jgi:hypothetical protein